MTQAFVFDCLRTPRGAGKASGALSGVPATHLLAGLLRELAVRTTLDIERIGEAIIGCVTQAGDQAGNVGKVAALEAGWSDSVPVATVNYYCASSLWAFNAAAARVLAGEGLMVAGGVESMSRVPMASDRPPFLSDPATVQRLRTPPMGVSADAIATLYGILREEAEAYAVQSQQRAAQARVAGHFDRSLVPVRDAAGAVLLAQDETIRADTSLEKLLAMPPYFAEMGAQWADALVHERYPALGAVTHYHHAGNSPAMADGASVVLLGSQAAGASLGLRPRARVIATAVHADEHVLALNGALGATRKALERAGLRVEEIDLFEVNEAFAAPTLVFARAFGIASQKLNVNGGAIALGHAMGATGTTLVGMLVDELERRGLRRGVAAVSGALGLGAAVVIEIIPG
jgi:acetyl-CoA C-acetyltransferase